MIRPFALAAILGAATMPAAATANDFPTDARVDYVIGCMAANGQSQDAMRRCSCSVDAVASILPYAIYERADTVLRMRSMGGETAALFRDVQGLRNVVDRLRAAQVEADFRCF
ncbi:MAG TPA: hypothetical protein VFQ57_10175 [Sphingomonas sp.]|jgi:poly-beta-hydroxyalkanoate depolymerase|nr:hypothetical protein [Sphingomonas sp.]